MSVTVIASSRPAAALLGRKAGAIACFLGWIRQRRDAHCISTLDPRLAGDAGLSPRSSWRTERLMIDLPAVLATEACGDRRLARQILELDHPGVLADFQNAGRSGAAAAMERSTGHDRHIMPHGTPSMRNVFAALVVVAVVTFGVWAYVGSTDTTANGLQSVNDRNIDSPIPQLPPVL